MFKKLFLIIALMPLLAYSSDWKLMESLDYLPEDNSESKGIVNAGFSSTGENSSYLFQITRLSNNFGNFGNLRLLHSGDQGFSWQYTNEYFTENDELDDFVINFKHHYSFGHDNFFMAMGYPSLITMDNVAVLGAAIGISNDSGKTFQVTEIYESVETPAIQMDMLNKNSGYFLLSHEDDHNLMFITEDSWKTYDTVKAPKDYTINYSSYLTKNIIQCAGYNYVDGEFEQNIRNYNIKTNTWNTVWHDDDGPDLDNIDYIHYKDDKTGFVYSKFWKNDLNALFRTTDAGKSWSNVYEFDNSVMISDIKFYDELNGYALGCSNASYPGVFEGGSKGVLFLTNDGGQTWVESKLPVEQFSNDPGGMLAEWIGKKLVAGEKEGKLFVYQGGYFNIPIGGVIPKLPSNGEQKTSLTPQLNWTFAPGATTYKLQVATEQSFSSPVVDIDDIDRNNFNLSSLDMETTYYWRVKAYNSNEETGWSEVFEFTTDKANSVNKDNSTFSLRPNPAQDYIKIDLESRDNVGEIKIFNSLGEIVKTTDAIHAGKIDVSHLSPGVYFVKIGDKVEKFIKY